MSSKTNEEMDGVYRVDVNMLSGVVVVQCIGLWCLDSTDAGEYSNINSLPEWIQRKVAILMLADTKNTVEGIGRRVSESIFFVLKPINRRDNDGE
jgi:hypothetical protein